MQTAENKHVGGRLEEIRADKRIKSARAFALSVNADPSFLAKIVKGEKALTEAIATEIANIYGVNLEWLYTGAGEKYKIGSSAAGDKYMAAVEKNAALLEKLLFEKEEDNKALRNALFKALDNDKRIGGLEATVNDLKETTEALAPAFQGFRKYVIDQLAQLKKVPRRQIEAAVNIEVNAFLKEAENIGIQTG